MALITTAAAYQPGVGDQGPGAKYNAVAKFCKVYSDAADTVPDVRISHVGHDRIHTTAEDPNAWFPLTRLQEAVKAGRIGALTRRGSTARRRTGATDEILAEAGDAPAEIERLRRDAVI